MTMTFDGKAFQEGLKRLEALIQEAERDADPSAQARTRAIVQALLELHTTGLGRLLEHLDEAGDAGRSALDACAGDEIVSGLLLLHGLHPLALEARVHQALESVRPYLRSHGGNVELLGAEDGVIRLRLDGSCHSCPSSTVTMKQTIEEAILARAPDATAVEVEGMIETVPEPVHGHGRVTLPILGAAAGVER